MLAPSWTLFGLFVTGMLLLDLFVFNRKAEPLSVGKSLLLVLFWLSLGLLFCGWVWETRGITTAKEFLTGYVIELSLSVDNLFVFLLIFTHFKVPSQYQHKVLFWGIVGAVVMRAFFIFLGVELLHSFHWINYIFGLILIVSGAKMLSSLSERVDPEKTIALKLARKLLPLTEDYHGDKFVIHNSQGLRFTPLFVVLLVVESTDLVFAVDSIPAVLAITKDPFIVLSSNVFAILGLRSLFFALSALTKALHYLNYGLAIILAFVGTKMLLSKIFPISVEASLSITLGILMCSVILSLVKPPKCLPENGKAATEF